jgi:uncharacterized delta-60 repeat protein
LVAALLVIFGLGFAIRDSARHRQSTAPAAAAADVPTRADPVASATPPATVPVILPERITIIGSGWKAPLPPAFAAFRAWTARYLAADPAARSALVAEGATLAHERRAELARLIKADPASALAKAVPMIVRQQLPAAIGAELETRVSGLTQLSLNGITAAPGGSVAESTFRSALVDGEEYRAYVYGRRADQATVDSTSVVGIAVDHALAVSESPLRALEPGEIAGDRPLEVVCPVSGAVTATNPGAPLNTGSVTAVEFNGKVTVLCHEAHVSTVEKALVAAELDHLQNAADSQPGSSSVTGRPTSAWTHGTKKLLIIRVDFSDRPGTPVIPSNSTAVSDDVAVSLITGPNGVADFYTQCSFNASTLQIAATSGGDSPDVTPVLRLPHTAAYYAVGDGTNAYNDTLHSDAETAATGTGLDLNSYDRIGVVFADLSGITGSQITYGGLGQIIGKNFWINGYYVFNIVAHEIGHNYGLNHANLWQVNDGNPVSPAGSSTEYGDVFDVMGGGTAFEDQFSHWNKSILQWIPDTAVTLGTSAGTYRIYRFDDVGANLANPRALKVVRDGINDYWIGYRRATTNVSLNNGAYVIWGYNANRQGSLLDLTTPGVATTHDEALAIGSTFNDSAAGISLKPLAQGGSGSEEYLDVQVSFQPRIQWSQPAFVVDEQSGTATLTLQRGQNGTGAVSVSYTTSYGTATTPADFTAQTGTVNWADGDSGDKTITIPIVAGASSGGTRYFSVTLGTVTGGVAVGSLSATVTIADPGTRDPNYNPDFLNSSVQKVLLLPDGSSVVGGWFSLIQDSGFNVYARKGITRLSATGAIDPTFASGGGVDTTPVYDLALQPDGKIIAVGAFTTYNGTARSRLARLNSDGSLDPSFDPGSGADGTIYAVMVQADGHIIVGGSFTHFNGTAREYVARLNSDGSLDSTFVGPDFASTSGWWVQCLAEQPDGKILAGGEFYFTGGANLRSGLCRLQANGSLDGTFTGLAQGAHVAGSTSSLESVEKIAIQPDGMILVAGNFTGFNGTTQGHLARLTSTGAIDSGFTAPSLDGDVSALVVLPDGSILVGGAFSNNGASPAAHLARFSGSGAFNSGFATSGGYGASVSDLELAPNGRVMLGGDYGSFQGSATARPVWTLIPGITGGPGTVQFASATASGAEGTTVTLQVTRAGGSAGALSVGYATVPGTATTADYTPVSGGLSWADGDTTAKIISIPLTTDALSEPTETFAVQLGQPVAGNVNWGAITQATVSILPPVSTVRGDFNADGHADLLWTNTATGDRAVWFMNGAAISSFGYLAGIPTEWHIVGEADFDADGHTDLVWENVSTGDRTFWMMNGLNIASFGYLAYVDPVWHISAIGDFDGDAKPDVIWENTTTGDRAIWFLDGQSIASFGYIAGIPTDWHIVGAADFDGDGHTDLVWENLVTGDRTIWYMNGTAIVSFGYIANIPGAWHIARVGDLDGDGWPDLAWENTTTGDRAVWLMNNATQLSAPYLALVDPVWSIAP